MYKIGFDAKRLFHNGTGLGNYSRSLVTGLYQHYPQHEYVLFSPSVSYSEESYFFTEKFKVITPNTFSQIGWRSRFMLNSLLQENIDIYHGLSHELPFGIESTSIKSVVTIHDLIYKFFPEDFPLIDKTVYDIKWKNACSNANAIIATSEATKKDIITYFGLASEKIHVVYQTCNPIFEKKITDFEIQTVLKKFNLPQTFFLYVGAITERKNVLNLVKAYNSIKKSTKTPLVIIGNGRGHLQKLKKYISDEQLEQNVIICSNVENMDLPAIYQAAKVFIYPSKYEGFGIPIIESLKSGTPVITSNVSCMPEVVGDAGILIDPENFESIAQSLLAIENDDSLRNELIDKGFIRGKLFSLSAFTEQTMNIYKKVL